MKTTGKGSKIAYSILIIVLGAAGYWWFYHNPQVASQRQETKKFYQHYQKAEATIVSQESNGRIGRGANTIFTIQFNDQNGTLQTTTMDQYTLTGKENGEKLIIYFDPEKPTNVMNEESYLDIMK